MHTLHRDRILQASQGNSVTCSKAAEAHVLPACAAACLTVPDACREEARALQELAQAISRHAAWPERASGLQVSMPRSTSGRARSEATITGGKMPRYRHPVWNFGSATNAQRVALLQVLLAGEAERLQVRDCLQFDRPSHAAITSGCLIKSRAAQLPPDMPLVATTTEEHHLHCCQMLYSCIFTITAPSWLPMAPTITCAPVQPT